MNVEPYIAKTGIDLSIGGSILALFTFANIEATLQFIALLGGAILVIGRCYLLFKEFRERGKKRNRRREDNKDDSTGAS